MHISIYNKKENIQRNKNLNLLLYEWVDVNDAKKTKMQIEKPSELLGRSIQCPFRNSGKNSNFQISSIFLFLSEKENFSLKLH